MIPFAKRVQAVVGGFITFLASLLFGIVFQHHLLLAVIVGLAILIVLWSLLALFLRRPASNKKGANATPLPETPVTEGAPSSPVQGSDGSHLLHDVTAASLAVLATPFVVASGHLAPSPPLAGGTSQSFADDVRRRLNESLGFIADAN
jgi:hypothetical protein